MTRPVDRSGEAGETALAGSTVGESNGARSAGPKTSQVLDTPSDLVGEIARELLAKELGGKPALVDIVDEVGTDLALRAIRAALAHSANGVSVREECAKVAEQTAPGMQWDGLAYSHGRKIAAAIRAQQGLRV